MTEDPLIGRVIAERYRIVEKIGAGAMASIYRAHDTRPNADPAELALKIVHGSLAKDETAKARFHREAKTAAKLAHPGVVRILDWGVDGARPYIAMELARGTDLYDVLEREGRLQQIRVLGMGLELCDVLQAAHDLGIVHRDLKPENIMLLADSGDRIKVLDFGVAKWMRPQRGDDWDDKTLPQQLTRVGATVGTPSHMAPEQARGRELDGRADLYACGVLFYEMVTGHLPFEADDPIKVAIKQVREQPPPPSQYLEELDPGFERVILRCLEKDPDDRPATAADLKKELRLILASMAPKALPSQTNMVWTLLDQQEAVPRPRTSGAPVTPVPVTPVPVTPVPVTPVPVTPASLPPMTSESHSAQRLALGIEYELTARVDPMAEEDTQDAAPVHSTIPKRDNTLPAGMNIQHVAAARLPSRAELDQLEQRISQRMPIMVSKSRSWVPAVVVVLGLCLVAVALLLWLA